MILDLVFIVLHVLWGVSGVWFLNLDREHNLPTAYQGVKLFAVASLAFGYWLLLRSGRMRGRSAWLLFSLLFAYLAVDDLSELHENVTYMLNPRLAFMHSRLLIFQPSMIKWMVLYAPFIAIGIALFSVLLWSLRRAERAVQFFFFLGCAFFASVPALEWMGAVARKTIFYTVPATIEEIFELLGQTFFIIALALLVRRQFHAHYAPRSAST